MSDNLTNQGVPTEFLCFASGNLNLWVITRSSGPLTGSSSAGDVKWATRGACYRWYHQTTNVWTLVMLCPPAISTTLIATFPSLFISIVDVSILMSRRDGLYLPSDNEQETRLNDGNYFLDNQQSHTITVATSNTHTHKWWVIFGFSPWNLNWLSASDVW